MALKAYNLDNVTNVLAAVDITAGLRVLADGTLAGANVWAHGVALGSVDSGYKCALAQSGACIPMIAGGTITKGDKVCGAAAGKVVSQGAEEYVEGVALDSATVGQIVLVNYNAKDVSTTISTAEIDDLAVTTAKLAADAVDGDKLADDAVDSEHIVDGSIDTAHIADSQVTTAKLDADAVTTAKILDAAITNAKLADAARPLVVYPFDIDAADLADGDLVTEFSPGYNFEIVSLDITATKACTADGSGSAIDIKLEIEAVEVTDCLVNLTGDKTLGTCASEGGFSDNTGTDEQSFSIVASSLTNAYTAGRFSFAVTLKRCDAAA